MMVMMMMGSKLKTVGRCTNEITYKNSSAKMPFNQLKTLLTTDNIAIEIREYCLKSPVCIIDGYEIWTIVTRKESSRL